MKNENHDDPRTGAHRLSDAERRADDAFARLADQCAEDFERNDGVPLAGAEQAVFGDRLDRPSPKVDALFIGRDLAEESGRIFARSYIDSLQDDLDLMLRAERRNNLLRRCEGALMTFVGVVLLLVAWAFMAPRGTP